MTLIDATTGEVLTPEVVPSSALAKPEIAKPGEPITLARITSQCRSIEVWAERCDSVADITDARNRLAAIEQYVASTSKDGRALIAAAQRRLEVRIGILLGPREQGRRSDLSTAIDKSDDGLTKDERSQFRRMADHADIVEAVIDDSDDATPASRRRTLDEINRKRHATFPEPTPEQQAAAEHAAHIARCCTRLEKVHEGWAQFAGLREHPDRDEILATLTDHDRTFILNLEAELYQ